LSSNFAMHSPPWRRVHDKLCKNKTRKMEKIKQKIIALEKKAEGHINDFHCFGQETTDALAYLQTLNQIDRLRKKLAKFK